MNMHIWMYIGQDKTTWLHCYSKYSHSGNTLLKSGHKWHFNHHGRPRPITTEGSLPITTEGSLPFVTIFTATMVGFPDSPGLQQVSQATWTAPHPQWLSSKILRSARQAANVSQLAVMACGDLYEEQDLSSIVHCPQGTEPSASVWYSWSTAELLEPSIRKFCKEQNLFTIVSSGLIVASGKRWTEPVVFYSLIIQFTSQGMNDSWNNTKRIK